MRITTERSFTPFGRPSPEVPSKYRLPGPHSRALGRRARDLAGIGTCGGRIEQPANGPTQLELLFIN